MSVQHTSVNPVRLTIFLFLAFAASFLAVMFGSGRSFDGRSRASFTGDEADIIIAGAGTGGTAAAIQAARLGSRVILLEETDWVGGQMTAAGVSSMDGGALVYTGGIYKEFIENVRAYYQRKGKAVETCYFSGVATCFEPSVGKKILENMIAAERNISLRLRTQVVSVTKTGNAVTGVLVKQNGSTKKLTSKILVDATEYGDLLPLAGAPYRAGNSTNASLNTAACLQDITYTAIIKKYPSGLPANLKIASPPPGYTKDVEKGFAQIVAKEGKSTWTGAYPVNWAIHSSYRGTPDSGGNGSYKAVNPSAITKTGINWANDFPVTVQYLKDKAYRKQKNCEAKLKTIQFLYYAQTVLGASDWSVATDEGYDTAYNREENNCAIIPQSLKTIERNMPVMPYVRESMRAIGSMTLTAKDIKRVGTPARSMKSFTSSIAIADYPVDLHRCSTPESLESSLESPSDKPEGFVGGTFQIPMEALIPSGIDQFIVAEKNLSQSRLANGATRLQPSTMVTGQAAGALAFYAAKHSILPRNVDVTKIQQILTENKAFITYLVDVPPTDTAFSALQQISARGIMVGSGNRAFEPNKALPRNHAAIALSKAFNIPGDSPSVPTFADVPVSDPYFSVIQGIYKAGITSGCSVNPNKFCPSQAVTNAQLAVFILRGWQKKLPSVQPARPTTPTYSDVPPTHFAYQFIEGLAAKGIKWYCDPGARKFCPDANATRRNTAVTIMAALNSK